MENLGEVLHGSVIQNSPYKIEMGKPDLKVHTRLIQHCPSLPIFILPCFPPPRPHPPSPLHSPPARGLRPCSLRDSDVLALLWCISSDVLPLTSFPQVLCKHDLTVKESKLLAQRIQQDYRVHLIMDNLPAATKVRSSHIVLRSLLLHTSCCGHECLLLNA